MSNIVTYKIQLDVKKVASQLSFSICKGDTGRRLVIQLISDGKVFNLSKGNYAVFSATKPDGTVIYNDCTISNDVITYDITEQTVSSIGNVEGEITLYDSTGYVITAPKFSIIVYDSNRSKVDLASYDELEALDQLMINEAARIEQEVLRVENEEQRGVHEAYRIASTYILRAYLNKLDLPILSDAKEIFSAIDEEIVTNNNRFFITNDGGITGIACLEYIPVEGDHIVSDPSIVTLVPNVVYRYKYVRFVCLNVSLPETNVFEHLEETVKQYEDKAKEWADIAEDKVEEITNEKNYNHPNGFVRLESNGRIPSTLIPTDRTIEMFHIDSEDDLTSLYQAEMGDIAYLSELVNGERLVTKSWRLFGNYFPKENWLLQATTFNSTSLYADESGHSQDTTKVNGVLVRFGDIAKYKSDTKDGLYIITDYAEEV